VSKMDTKNKNADVLIVDEEDLGIESTVYCAYEKNREIPFAFNMVRDIDSAIEELERHDYKLILSTEFVADDESVPDEELTLRGGLLRLLQFLLDTGRQTRVCVMSPITLSEFEDELYRSYPNTVGLFGRRLGARDYLAIRKIIRQYVPAAEETRKR